MAVVGEDGCCIATRSKHSGKKVKVSIALEILILVPGI